MLRRAADLQDDLDNAFRTVGECDEDDRTECQLDRMLCFKADAQPVVFEQVPDPHQENQPNADGGKNIVHRLGCREVAQKRVHPTAERTEYRRVDEVQTVHDLFGDPFDNAVKNPHALCRPLTAGEERRDVGHDEAKAVQDCPGDRNTFEPCARFLDRPAAA